MALADFTGRMESALADTIRDFVSWCVAEWTAKSQEDDDFPVNLPTDPRAAFNAGWNAAIESMPMAIDIWCDEDIV